MRTILLFTLVAAVGCHHAQKSAGNDGGDPPPGTGGNGTDAGATPPPPSANPIDVAIWPRALAAGVTKYTPAPTDELCRRISLDLTGVTPTAADIAARCTGKSPADMVAAFLASPRYAAHEATFWAEHLNVSAAWAAPRYILDADRLVGALAGGTLGYDDFVAKMLAHPVLAGHHQPFIDHYEDGGDHTADLAGYVIGTFLGRAPTGDEAIDLGNLFRVWHRVAHPVPHAACPTPGQSCSGDYFHPENGHDIWSQVEAQQFLDPGACKDPLFGAARCTSSLFGATVMMSLPLSGSALVGYDALVGGKVPADLQKELEKPGRLLAARAEFWDAIADLALRRFVGWWQSTKNVPDSVVPEVRAALAAWFRATPDHDLRTLYATVMTSVLYASTSFVDAAVTPDPPVWAMGPRKEVTPEMWIDSAAQALGKNFGRCDRSGEQPSFPYYWPVSMREPVPADAYPFDRFYEYTMGDLGGCRGPNSPSPQITLKKVFAQAGVAKTLCTMSGVALAPPDFDLQTIGTPDALAKLVRWQLTRFVGRDATAAELSAIAKQASCVGAATGACDPVVFAQQLCASLMRSTTYLFY